MDNYNNQRYYYGSNGDKNARRSSPNGSYNNRNSYNGSNGGNNSNGRYRNNGYNSYNSYNGGGNTSDNSDRSDRSDRSDWNDKRKPPREWKTFTEIKFRVSNIHTNATVTDIMEAFAAYGSVYRVEIVTEETDDSDYPERPTGTAYIIFKPVPTYPFWDNPVRFHGRPLQFRTW
ncbi:unnamed protein product [Rhizophagus irregularis]|uniref:RRM domain-containing protein n=1 Tax=Rhizophagus irregularis TaxID=588596 RepID=A0A915Z041_9GLOM|nr:unnamed protein product [Rhizophagus irregularis]CAB5217176.1 unnamed protein product [Rhizophagus irregularis]CAB5357193.1 unnamed protein product [Rhizophagus irregularis]